MNEKPVLMLWTTTAMGGCSSLPTPGERLDNDFSGPPSLLWSPWLGTRCSKSNTSLQLSINSELSVCSLSPNGCNKNQVTAAITHNTSLLFSLFPQ